MYFCIKTSCSSLSGAEVEGDKRGFVKYNMSCLYVCYEKENKKKVNFKKNFECTVLHVQNMNIKYLYIFKLLQNPLLHP